MKISERVNVIDPSLTRDLFNRALKFDDVIDLTLGDPDLPPPQSVRDAACAAIQQSKTRYSANAGLLDVRRHIASQFVREYGQTCDAEENVIVTVGGMEALYLAFSVIINPGDEVLLFAPYYVNYVQMIRMNGGIPIIVDTEEENGFAVEPTRLGSYVTARTVAVVVNSPCNPTGMMLPSALLREIATVAQENDLVVVSDEVYKSLVYDGATHHSVLEFPGMCSRTILVDSLSKRYAMTGWRLGWAIGPRPLIAAMTKMQENVAACAPLPSQHAAIQALEPMTDVGYIKQAFVERRNFVYAEICAIDQLSALKPEATFYIFVNIGKTGLTSLEFSLRLLDAEHVAVVPGVAYGKSYDKYIRIAFTKDVSVLAEACARIRRFVASL